MTRLQIIIDSFYSRLQISSWFSEFSFLRKGVDITAQRRHIMKLNDITKSPAQRQLLPIKSDKKRLSGTSCDNSVYSARGIQ